MDICKTKPIEILLVEDNPGDVGLVKEALAEGKIVNNLHVADDGVEAMKFLRGTGRSCGCSLPGPDPAGLESSQKERQGSAPGNQIGSLSENHSCSHSHEFKGRRGHLQILRRSCELLCDETGRLRFVSECGEIDRGFLVLGGQIALQSGSIGAGCMMRIAALL